MEIETLLKDEIVDEFSRLSKIEVGTDAYKTTVDGITKLMDRAIEINKFHEDCKTKEEARKLENEMKQKQLEEQIKTREADNEMKRKQLEEQIKTREVDTELKQKQFEVETKDQFINGVENT